MWNHLPWQEQLDAGWSLVGCFQPVLMATPSSVRYDFPLCSVAELRQKNHCDAQALETLCGEKVTERDSSAFPH